MSSNSKFRFTIFTPTYNRAYIIDVLFRSLEKQTFKDFEWLIIDQGNDETESKVKEYIAQKTIPNITYIKTGKRKGINRAINDALNIAKGELFFKVDDDDYLTDDALECLDCFEKTLEEKTKFAGISGLRGYHDGTVIGSEWKHKTDFIDATGLERAKYGLNGDKAEAYYLEVLKKYGPLPEFEGETVTFESILYDDIANAGLKIRWFNRIIYYTEYLPDGATMNTRKRLENNLNTYACLLDKILEYKSRPLIWILKNLCRYCEMSKRKRITRSVACGKIKHGGALVQICWMASSITKFLLPSGGK